MKGNKFCKRILVITTVFFFLSASFSSSLGNVQSFKISPNLITVKDFKTNDLEYPLPPPINTDIILEESIYRRKSVRNFTDDPITDEELSTILWAAHGLREDGTSTVPSIDGMNGAVIYVLKQDAAYTYNPENHSLVFYKAGDWRDIVGHQYHAPIQLAMCIDTLKIDKNLGSAEIGMIDQNIQLMANALDLGTVVTAQIPPATDPLGIPHNQLGFTVMPLGHPDYESYKFKKRPMWISLLPKVKSSNMSLSEVLELRNESESFKGKISRRQLSQIVWSTCGFSPYIDKSGEIYHKGRHRTIPSGKGYYPVDIYVVKNMVIYKYEPHFLVNRNVIPIDLLGLPIITYLKPVKFGFFKETIADACIQELLSNAEMIILFVLDREKTRPPGLPDLSGDILLHTWFHDAGAGVHNVMLESAAWGLNANFYEIKNQQLIIDLLNLNEETTIPIFAVPIGS